MVKTLSKWSRDALARDKGKSRHNTKRRMWKTKKRGIDSRPFRETPLDPGKDWDAWRMRRIEKRVVPSRRAIPLKITGGRKTMKGMETQTYDQDAQEVRQGRQRRDLPELGRPGRHRRNRLHSNPLPECLSKRVEAPHSTGMLEIFTIQRWRILETTIRWITMPLDRGTRAWRCPSNFKF